MANIFTMFWGEQMQKPAGPLTEELLPRDSVLCCLRPWAESIHPLGLSSLTFVVDMCHASLDLGMMLSSIILLPSWAC